MCVGEYMMGLQLRNVDIAVGIEKCEQLFRFRALDPESTYVAKYPIMYSVLG